MSDESKNLFKIEEADDESPVSPEKNITDLLPIDLMMTLNIGEKKYSDTTTAKTFQQLSAEAFETRRRSEQDDFSKNIKFLSKPNNSQSFGLNMQNMNLYNRLQLGTAYLPFTEPEGEDDIFSYSFGKPGWICADCKNFNFESNSLRRQTKMQHM